MSTIHVNIVSAEAELYSGEANMVILPGAEGELGIKPKHTPLLTSIKPGLVRIVRDGQEEESVFVAGGYIEVQPDLVTVLADTAVRAADLDLASAEEAKKAAEDALAGKSSSDTADFIDLHAQLAVAAAQLEFLKKIHRR